MRAFVYLGPSLPREEAERLLGATFLPPIQQGDLVRLLAREPDPADLGIGIVDGYFETVPAIWHKEILLALSRGARVWGAASMGALRAAELCDFGMVGVGTVFGWYRDGTLTADDEVAVQHGPAELGYLPLSLALVDVRHGIARARTEGAISDGLAAGLLAAARALPYPERGHAAILARAEAAGADPAGLSAWRDFVARRWESLKARDAAALLEAMRAAPARAPGEPTFVLAETIFLDRLRNAAALEAALPEGAAPAQAEALRDALLVTRLAREVAAAEGWAVEADELRAEAEAILARLGLPDGAALRARLAAAGLDEAAFWAHVRDGLLVRRLTRRHRAEIDRELALRLRLERALGPDGA